MRILLNLIVSFLSTLLICNASEPAATQLQQVDDDTEQLQLQYYSGYTLVSLYSYHVKIIAEQRMSDMLVQVVVVPEDEGIGFKIQNVSFETVPSSNELSGPVAQVRGVFSVQMGFQNPTLVPQIVPVQVAFVDGFSINENEARMQGVVTFQKQLPNMLSGY